MASTEVVVPEMVPTVDAGAPAVADTAGGSVSVVEVPAQKKRNRIQVSSKKKPLFFYVNLAKRIMQQQNEVVLSALGMAIGTVVTVAEILKNNGLATEKRIETSTVDAKDDIKGRPVQKAKIEILLGKSENFSDLMNAAKAERSKPIKDGRNEEKPVIVEASAALH